LSQHGQSVYYQTIKIIGSKGELTSVRILGGFRKQTQVELTESEAVALGIKTTWRMSGRLSRSGGCKLVGPNGTMEIKNGVIIPLAHVHLNNKEAGVLNVKQGQEVELLFVEDKTVKIKAIVRIHPSFKAALHLTSEQAAKFWFSPTEKAKL
jgi:propanediol utilization protein